MSDLNKFKHLILIVGDSPESLTLKLQSIPFAYHYLKVWSDGKRHYAHINGNNRLSPSLKSKLDKIK